MVAMCDSMRIFAAWVALPVPMILTTPLSWSTSMLIAPERRWMSVMVTPPLPINARRTRSSFAATTS